MALPGGASPQWEEAVYAKGKQVNRYPFDFVVASVAREFVSVPRDLRGGVRILEIGCGSGSNVWFLCREGFAAAGIDASATAISMAGARLGEDRLSADLRVGDFGQLPWPDRSFACVIDRFSMTHNRRAHVEKTLAEVHRVLAPGGIVCSQVASVADSGRAFGRDLGDGARDQFHDGAFRDLGVTFFAAEADIRKLFGTGFAIERMAHHRVADLVNGGERAWFETSGRKQ